MAEVLLAGTEEGGAAAVVVVKLRLGGNSAGSAYWTTAIKIIQSRLFLYRTLYQKLTKSGGGENLVNEHFFFLIIKCQISK